MESRTLQHTYGCPNCADGGVESVELATADFTKRVTFEYGNATPELDAIVRELRATFPIQ